MIFISHAAKDKLIVEPLAQKIADVFGQDKVFYDSWSVQPGDGIIDKMNNALSMCKFFFFFVSKNSLDSNMVKLEWQNALYKATQNQVRLVPVKLDDCLMPDILLQTLYIDFFGQGEEVALRQIIDIISGNNIYRNEIQKFQNIRGYVRPIQNGCRIEFRAHVYMEPQSHFAIAVENNEDEIICSPEGTVYPTRFIKDQLIDGKATNFIVLQRPNPTSPGFPFIINITSKTNSPIKIEGLFRATSSTEIRSIPVIHQ